MWLIVTIVVFLIARQIAIKINSPLANPLLISIAVLIPLLTYLNVPFETYYAD
ncbi:MULTISPECIES: LrgB family protein, partial [unclassified Vibrio]